MLLAEIVAFDAWPMAGVIGGAAAAFGLVLSSGIVGGAWVVSRRLDTAADRLDKLADAVRQLDVGLHVMGARMEAVERAAVERCSQGK